MSNLRHISTNSNGELITVREENTAGNINCQLDSCVTSYVNITTFNNNGILSTDDYTYVKNDDDFTPSLLADHDNSNLSILMHVAGQMDRDNQIYSCPPNSEYDYCLMRINYDFTGNFQFIQSVPQPRVFFSAMSLHQGNLLLAGMVVDWTDDGHFPSSNFTGILWENDSFSPTMITYVTASLSPSGWDYVNHLQTDSSSLLIRDEGVFFDKNGNTILILGYEDFDSFRLDNSTIFPVSSEQHNAAILSFNPAGHLIAEQYIYGADDQYIWNPIFEGDVLAMLIENQHNVGVQQNQDGFTTEITLLLKLQKQEVIISGVIKAS